MEIESFKLITRIINNANKKFGDTYKINEAKFEEIRRYSLALDKIIEEVEAHSFEVEIDKDEKTIRMSIECIYAFVEDCRLLYRDLIDASISFGFTPAGDDMLSLNFVFPGVWDRI